LFTDLSEGELAVVAERATRQQYDAGTMIFSEGQACRELLIVEEGSVRLLKTAANGRQQLIAIERAGNSLAEVPVFDAGCYTATAEALSPTTLVRLEAEHFRRLCLQHPQVAVKFIRALAHRLRHLDRLVEELSFSSVRGRLIAYLLRLVDERGRRSGSGVEFELNENNEELAARLGTVRELISRNLGRLHGEGLIKMRRRTVTVPDAATLEKAARTD
jgi:CRP/FNR family cyclic AMP-dependent transcriptional regulator